MLAQTQALAAPRMRLRDIASLGKPRLSALVLTTTAIGVWFAPTALVPLRALMTLLATALLVGAANALNAYAERDVDGLMLRTQDRPLPAQRLEPRVALVVGLFGGFVATALLMAFTNVLTACLGLCAYVLYAAVYTPLKRRTAWALVVGAIPGAMPPLMGWTAMTGAVDSGGLALFAILFAWQLPHFLAISLYLRDDYVRGGLRVTSDVLGEVPTKVLTLLGCAALGAVSFLPYALGLAPVAYAWSAAALLLVFLVLCTYGVRREPALSWGRRVFLATLVYLPVLLGTLIGVA